MNYTDFEILQNGDLKISLTAEGREVLPELMEKNRGYSALADLIETQLCNGWHWLNAEQIGALTDSPILSNDVEYIEGGEYPDNIKQVNGMWWLPDYMVTNELEELDKNGFIIFTKA